MIHEEEVILTDEATEYLQEAIYDLTDEEYHALIRMVDAKGGKINLEDVESIMHIIKNGGQ